MIWAFNCLEQECLHYISSSFHCILVCRVRQRPDVEANDPVSARKVQKADREKLRRDRLNEHFLELGNAVGTECISVRVTTS